MKRYKYGRNPFIFVFRLLYHDFFFLVYHVRSIWPFDGFYDSANCVMIMYILVRAEILPSYISSCHA